MRADQERVRELLTDTVTLLCKNGLHFGARLRIEGVLGITIDDSDVFIVHINESLSTNEDSHESRDDGNSSLLADRDPSQTNRSTSKPRKSLMNHASPNQGEVPSAPALSVREGSPALSLNEGSTNSLKDCDCKVQSDPSESASPRDIYVRATSQSTELGTGTDHSTQIVKSEDLCTDQTQVIVLDNDDEPDIKFDRYSSQNICQLSKSRVAFENSRTFRNRVNSKFRKTNHVNQRFQIPSCSRKSSEKDMLVEMCGKESDSVEMAVSTDRSSFDVRNSGEVSSSDVDVNEMSLKQEDCLDQINEEDYWNGSVCPNLNEEFGVCVVLYLTN